VALEKIPEAALAKREGWGHDGHSLEIENLPEREKTDGTADDADRRRWDGGQAFIAHSGWELIACRFFFNSERVHHARPK
jgi:hypothetical protein